ncbi:MAG: phosphate/phosphite/phosphonate ABC transporter substrate-binding protein [Pseudomonadota bacterium]
MTLSIVPQQSASKLARLWTPIVVYLSEKTGHTIQFATAKDIPTFEERLAEGHYDIAYMNPYHYTVFSREPGYEAFARQKDKRIKGIVVVKKDSPLSDLYELEGETLAFPSPAAFAASVLPRSHFREEGIDITPQYVSSHDSVYLSVAAGFFPAGGGVMRTFNNADPEVREKLKVFWTTKTYTPHAFAAHPRVPQDVVDSIAAAMMEMNTDPEGQALLKSINFKGVQPAKNEDWNDVRGLGIELLADLGQ